MASIVKLRKPRNVLGSGQTYSQTLPRNRPKSWSEFHTRFQAVTGPINIDISPDVKANHEPVIKRKPNNYRKVRPLSASLLDQADLQFSSSSSESFVDATSPAYASFMAPNPWRKTSKEQKETSVKSKSQSEIEILTKKSDPLINEKSINYDVRQEAWNLSGGNVSENNVPEANITAKSTPNSEINACESKVSHSNPFLGRRSKDSPLNVPNRSAATSHSITSSKKKPNRQSIGSRRSKSVDLDSSSMYCRKEAVENNESVTQSETQIKRDKTSKEDTQDRVVRTLTLVPPTISVTNWSDEEMDLTLDLKPEVYENGKSTCLVPSPLKSCYASVASYNISAEEYSYQSDDSSEADDDEASRCASSVQESKKGGIVVDEYMKRQTPVARPRQASLRKENPQVPKTVPKDRERDDFEPNIMNSSTWPRRRSKNTEDDPDPEELLRKFRETRDVHMAKIRNIYEASRKKMQDMISGLQTITEAREYSRSHLQYRA